MKNDRNPFSIRQTCGVLVVAGLIAVIIFLPYLRGATAPSDAQNIDAAAAQTAVPSATEDAVVSTSVFVPSSLSRDRQQSLIQELSRSISIQTTPNPGNQRFAPLITMSVNAAVRSVAVNSSETLVASGLENGAIVVWNITGLNSGSQIPVQLLVDHSGPVASLAFDPQNGQRLASGSNDATIKIWDVGSGQVTTTLAGHTDTVSALAFSPNGALLASGAADTTIRLWNAQTGAEMGVLQQHNRPLFSLAIDPLSQQLVSAGGDNKVILWDLQTRQMLSSLGEHTDWVSGVAFTPADRQVLSVSYDKTALLWNPQQATAQYLFTDPATTGALVSVAVHPSGQLAAAASSNNTIYTWNLLTREPLESLLGGQSPITSIAFSPRGTYLVSGSVDGATTLRKMYKSYTYCQSLCGESLTR
ncbi:MAG: WD40 repeat domain-containing protein [Caldilineaceae bacterium]